MDTNLPPVKKFIVHSASSMPRNIAITFKATLTPGKGGRPLVKAPAETVSALMASFLNYNTLRWSFTLT